MQKYYKAQGMFGIPRKGECDYSVVLDLDLASIGPSVAGPKRPQDRIELSALKDQFNELMVKPVSEGGYGKTEDELWTRYHVKIGADRQRVVAGGGEQRTETVPAAAINHVTSDKTPTSGRKRKWSTTVRLRTVVAEIPEDEFPTGDELLGHGDVLIAAITSCTNTSNPSVMLAAGLLAKKAVEQGLTVSPKVKNSLAPGSRVVTEYLERTGLQPYLNELGLQSRRLWLHDLHRQLWPTRSGHRTGRQRTRCDRRVSAFRQSKLRSARASEHQSKFPDEPAARGCVCARRTRRSRPVD